MTDFLYRGVPLEWHQEGRGLRPRGTNPEYQWAWGEEGYVWGGGQTWGASTTNGVLQHQLLKRSYPDSPFISTTPHFERAKAYALHSSRDGIVYELDPARFDAHKVTVFKVREIVALEQVLGEREDDEHSLLATPPGPIPDGVVVRVIRVQR